MCVYCSRLVLSSVQSQPKGERARLEKAYITVSIVTCSIVPKDAGRNCWTEELMDTLKPERVEITRKEVCDVAEVDEAGGSEAIKSINQ